MAGPGVRGQGSRLFLRYAAAGLLPVLLLGLVLVRSEQSSGLERGLSQGRAQAAVIEQMALSPALQGHDVDEGLSTAERERLQEATDLAIFSGSVARLRLRGFSGRVVFSDDGLNSSPVSSSSADFRAAAGGRTVAAIVTGETGLPDGERAIRVLQPVVPAASGRAVGVLEVTLPYEPIDHLVDQQLTHTYLLLAGGLGVLYVALGLISWSTTARLRRHAADQEHAALHDALTGLPNRALFRDSAEAALRGSRPDRRTAVVLVDLDRFKQVNDGLGHSAGDVLLQVVAQRMRGVLRTGDTVARLGGDEFGLVLPDVGSRAEVVLLLEGLREALAKDAVLEGTVVTVEASLGVALAPDHGRDLDQLLRHADAAMYASKRGTTGVVVHRELPPLGGSTAWPGLRDELGQALQADELRLHHRPTVALATGEVLGLQAQPCWQHAERGLLHPSSMPAVQQSDQAGPLLSWLLRRALEDRACWTAAGATWPVGVDLTARDLAAPGVVAEVAATLAATGSAPSALALGVGDGALAADPAGARAALAALADLGVALSVRTRSSATGLRGLAGLPVGELRVDTGLVQPDPAAVRLLVALGHDLGCAVTAEGVASPAAATALLAAGCDRASGPLYGPPAAWRDLRLPAGPVPSPHLPRQDVSLR